MTAACEAAGGDGVMGDPKTNRNVNVQARYDELMREGRHGHYESMFRVVREEVELALLEARPDASQEWITVDAAEVVAAEMVKDAVAVREARITALTEQHAEMLAALKAIDKYLLVIESAVRNDAPSDLGPVTAALKAGAAAIAKAEGR